jgi:2-phospho-L-lactate guanylyltransferase
MWALLPLKEFAHAKQRLAGVLTPEERRDLFAAMVEDVLSVLHGHPDIENTLIISEDEHAFALARNYGAVCLSESNLSVRGLNEAVQAGVDQLAHAGIDEVMVIHGDLPLISAADIRHLVLSHQQLSQASVHKAATPALTIAPDEHRQGTNCLLCTPASSMTFCYGANSFTAHAVKASHVDMPLQVVSLPGVACDIDTPDDLNQLIQRASATCAQHSHRYIVEHDLSARIAARKNRAEANSSLAQVQCVN